jgi:acetyl/propionyl-CoA carboxylase alpha subunit/acetyl-CoA carboxylase carboxyltransferase component
VNRGEPAVRLINAVAEYNTEHGTSIQTIALYTDPDANSMYVREADLSFHLGSAHYVDTEGNRKVAYLDYDAVERALTATSADAVWVGWGFVAEHPEFAARCKRLGITFLGPDPDAMELLGDKIASKRIAERAGVPVAPWSRGAVATADDAVRIADELGYPVMIKATAGGGGRGIRRVDLAVNVAEAFKKAQAEALGAFGDDTMFIEKAISGARHIEVQIVGDVAGTVWPIGVRDCTVQRRNQKLFEEAPSPALNTEQDAAIKAAAARLGREAGYVGAGTVEFLYEPSNKSFSFMEVNTRLQVEHPITEVTTGVDLVKLQIHVARGGTLDGVPPETRGHAIEARLNAEDPERGFAPSPGKIELLRFPTGPGIRIDTGVEEQDTVPAEFDSMVAKVIALGDTREEACSRLSRALGQSRVVIREGSTNKAFLQSLLHHPAFVSGDFDIRWVDGLVDSSNDAFAVEHAEAALISAAIAAYNEQIVNEIAVFRDSANHGRPEIHPDVGQTVKIRYRGHRYEFHVAETARHSFRIRTPDCTVDADIERLGRAGIRLSSAGRTHRVLSVIHGATHFVEVDGVAHRITHDEGGVIRAPSPAVVVAVEVGPGDLVQPGDRLAIIESMKMETSLTAEFAGSVREVLVRENTQVSTGTPLLIIDPDDQPTAVLHGGEVALDPYRVVASDVTHRACHHYLETLRAMLLGWDVLPEHLNALAAPGSEACPGGSANPATRRLEDEVLQVFVDVISLFRRALPEDSNDGERRTTEEYLFDYLRDLGAHRGTLPESFTSQLLNTLRYFGVESLDDTTPQLVGALFRITKSHARMARQTPFIVTVLEDRLANIGEADERLATLLDQLIRESQDRYPAVCDLALELRYAAFDMPFLEQVRDRSYAEVDSNLALLEANPGREDREELITALVDCSQPLKPRLSKRFGAASPPLQEILLEVMTRRYYRVRDLKTFTHRRVDGLLLTETGYRFHHHKVRVVSTHADYADLKKALKTLRRTLADTPEGADVAVDIYAHQTEAGTPPTKVKKHIASLIDKQLGPLQLMRIVVAVSGPEDVPSLSSVLNFTFRARGDDRYEEETLYQDLHPMMAERLELWRLSKFDCQRLPTLTDIYLFHAVAKDNPRDERLFAQAEVRDLTPIRDEHGMVVRLPEFERVFRDTLGPIRRYQAHRDPLQRLHWNRVVLYVWPVLLFTPEEIEGIVYRVAGETRGLGIERVLVRVKVPENGTVRNKVLIVNNPGDGRLRMTLRDPGHGPMMPISDLGQKIVRLRRRGLAHPIEIIDLLINPAANNGAANRAAGVFTEYDLDDLGQLQPVERPPGSNSANVVVGVVSTPTDRYPEGMKRVVILGDPSRGMGNLAEAECHRINAAMDLAEELQLPLEWFAVSAGARIAMDSGTENMDWIARVLRRIVEFTQAGNELNVIVVGINVGAQPYWNAEATMLMHTKGILIMTPDAAMVLTGKRALDYSGGVSAEDDRGIGGYERIMGPNGQAQYFARDLTDACRVLFEHYRHTYVEPGERFPRQAVTSDPSNRDITLSPHGGDFPTIGDLFSAESNPDRKRPFDIRRLIAAATDSDSVPLERWHGMQHAETAVVLDAFIGGHSVTVLGIESKPMERLGFVPADGPLQWTSGTLFPVASKKVARAINAASGNRPLVVLANLSGFDGSPESMRRWQLEFGAEIGRSVVNFDGPIIFCVVSRYHGGAFVVFSKTLNDNMEIAALEGSKASVIGGAPAAAVVFVHEVRRLVAEDPRIQELQQRIAASEGPTKSDLRHELDELREKVQAEKRGEVATRFDSIHSVERAKQVGSIDTIIPAESLRPYLIDAIERGKANTQTSSA